MEARKSDLKNLALIFALFLGAAALTACSRGGGDASGIATPVGDTGLYQVCTATGCVYTPGTTQLGFYAQTSNFYLPGYVNNGSKFYPRTAMTAVLRDAMGVCDRQYYSGGYAACNAWLSGAHDLVLLAPGGSTSNTVKLIIRSIPSAYTSGYSWYSYSAPSFQQMLLGLVGFPTGNAQGVFDPMVLDATIWPINNSQGFEVRTYGPRVSPAYNQLFQLQVTSGKLEDAQFNFKLQFNGQLAADGTAVRCQTQYCGLDSSYYNTSGM